jgi:hypothetical protein
LAINPRDDQHLVAVMQLGRYGASGVAGVGFAVSRDGGTHWTDGVLPGLTVATGGPYPKSSDPAVAFGPDGTVYASADALPDTDAGANGIATWRSADGGRSWQGPVIVGGDNASATADGLNVFSPDKSELAVDTVTGSGHHYGRVYLAWFREGQGPVFTAYSDDRAASWQAGPAGTGYPMPDPGSAIPQPLVMPDGGLAVVLEDGAAFGVPMYSNTSDTADSLAAAATDGVTTGNGGNFIRLWTDPTAGSATTGQPLVFTEHQAVGLEANGAVRQQRTGTGNGFYSAAVDPATGQLYVAWGDGRYRSDGVNDIVMTTSADRGRTWTFPQRINTDSTRGEVDHYDPVVAVGPGGAVILAYRQRQEAADITAASWTVHTMLQVSTDHGRTFSAPTQVDQEPTDLRFAADSCCASYTDPSSSVPFLIGR